ncbi:MAG TPA: GIY-YIG nuclease family protein [Candidatus Paceibacterota bacterium]|nr:GIY-YIG nuclease family protein [Candidatus Paceibacterota bacterium]
MELKGKKILLTGSGGFPRPHRQRAEIHYTYVLESFKDGQLYIGWTNDLKKRLIEHLSGKVPATKWRLPLHLIYFEGCLRREAAIKREKYFKTGFGRRFLSGRLAGSRGGRVGSIE